jgi:EAL domain-containing protein (putative c-di-GMP-specific phosphodiesterase class I)
MNSAGARLNEMEANLAELAAMNGLHPEAAAPALPDAPQVWDPAVLADMLGDSAKLQREMIESFFSHAADTLSALRGAYEKHEAGLDITLSVNLSTTSLADVTLADRVTAIVTGCSDNPSAQVIIEASIGLAHGLKLKTVAEGIETQADWEALKGMGCDLAQGYFIAQPMDVAGFLHFCQSRAQPAPGV